jgi:subtilisin-like proprotein convertase family protein
MWFGISLLCFVGALYCWRLANKWEARKHAGSATPNAQTKEQLPAARSHSTVSASTVPLVLLSQPQPAVRATNWLAYRFKNTSKSTGQLLRDDRAILLENATIDTSRPLGFSMPEHLRATGDPGSYIVQAHGAVDDKFRAALSAAGAKIISYIPNNAYLVRVTQSGAELMSGNPQTQTVLPYEPAYKLKAQLFKLAMDAQPLPEGTALNVVVFDDAREETLAEFAQRGVEVLAESRSPFGPVLKLRPAPADWFALARLPGVEIVEVSRARVPANDLSRVRIGVAADTQVPTNYLSLTGSNVVVNLNDTGVSTNHPDLVGRVFYDVPTSGVDLNGHGTHVAGIIAGDGTQSMTVTNARGSINPGTNFQYRGKAPATRIFSIGEPLPPDSYLQERAAQTNALISNNSWNYGGDTTYSIGAASFDAATRDALPRVTGSQPLLFVFGAGNAGRGDDSGQSGDPESILSPATAKNVITVGAIEQPRDITNVVVINCTTTNINGTNVIVCTTNQPWKAMTSSPNEVAAFSSRGNVGIGIEGDFGRYKPDLMAPGTFVISTRAAEWDQGAYYNPTSHIVDVLDIVILTNRAFTNLISVPNNAVAFTIRLVRNQNSPSPFPDLPIFVRQAGPPSDADPVATNLFSVPGTQIAALTPVGTTWYYRISNITTQNVSLAIVTDLVITNELGNYLEVLSNLNNTIGPYYRYESGTSMAAADVSGTLALMQEFFQQRMTPPVTNSPALYKALLINGARSLPAYDLQVQKNTANFQGWGLLNLPNSLPVSITNGVTHLGAASMEIFDQSPTNALATGQSQTRLVSVNDFGRTVPLRVTLVWTDPPGNPTAGVKLVNDLDLIVTNLDTGDVFLGNDIGPSSPFTFAWDTNAAPNADSINNVENVYLPPQLGSNYSVTVLAHHVNVNAVTAHTNGTVQDYALVISSGDGEVPDALTMGAPQPIVGTNLLTIGTITNSFLNNTQFSGSLLTGQRVGANTPLLGTTNGMANQWHFYVITNTSTFTNAGFVTFLPPTLSIPRMGVFVPDPDNATRVEADIDLYVSLNPGLTNLDPVVIASADKSRGRGGTEFVVYSNSVPDRVYYVGVKAEDQMAAEYIFLGVFSLNPFSQRDTNGNLIVLGLPVPAMIPDGNPANPGVALVLGLAIEPISVRRVVVTNSFYHENPGDLVGTLVHQQRFAVLNNHRGGLPDDYKFVYEDNGEGNVPFAQHTDGPGNLRDFVGESGFGVWLLAMVDNADSNTGRVESLTLRLEPQNVSSNGTTRAVQPNTFTYDFIDVPASATNLTVCVAGSTGPMDLYVLRGDFPSRTVYDKALTNIIGGGCLTITPFDVPPLSPGRYYIGVFNSSGSVQNIRIFASVILNPASIASVASSTVGPVTLLDDAVTYASFNVTNHLLISDLDVGLLIQHQRISDLAITLISPRGTRILLFENRGMASPNGLGTFNFTTNGLGAVGLEVTNTLWFYTNDFEAAPVGLYAPGAVFQGWHVLTNMVAVLPDFSDLSGTNKLLALWDGVVSNTLPTTNSTSFNLSFQVTRAPYLVGTVGWWPLDEDARDIFGGLDGLLCCNVTFKAGKVGQAYYGDGIATSMKVPRCRELDLGRGRGFSIEGWVRPVNVTNAAPLVEWNDPTNQFPLGVQFWLANRFLTNGGPGSLSAVIWDTNSQPHFIEAGPFALTNALPNSPTNSLTNGWQHVALTYDKSGVANLYINGLVGMTTNLGSFIPRTSGDLFFGYHPAGPMAGTAFAGGLDEFGVYERALSDCEIAAIFKANYRGKYGTNVLTCPVVLEVGLNNAVTALAVTFTNGLSWTNGPHWETDTINFTDLPQLATTNGPATNFTRITVRPLDPNVAVDNFTLSAFVTNVLSGLLHFTEDTNLAITPIKFAAAPYMMTNFPPMLIFSNDFENATQGVYKAGDILPGSINAPAVGVRDWTVVAGPLTVISNASFAAVGTNWVALAAGAVQCELPTIAGHRYELTYTVRGPCAVGWWPGDIEPLSQRAQDVISGNHGAFINGATNSGAGFVVTPRGANALSLAGMIDATNQIATKIELGDPPQLRLTNALTIEGWVRPQQQTNNYILSLLSASEESVIEQIFFRGDSRQCRDPYWLALEQADVNHWHILFHVEGPNSSTCGITAEYGGTGIDDGWHHIAAVFERNVAWTNNAPWPTNQMRLYVDGQPATNLLTEPFENAPFDGLTGENPFAELDSAFSPGVAIGNRSRYDNSQPFRGSIDELTVYGRALTDPEIKAIAGAGRAGKADLVVPPDHSLAKVSVSLDNDLMDVGYGDNAEWTTRKVVFTARNTNMVLKLESNLPGTIVDAVSLTELPAELNFLPEESLAALNGEDAFGTWRLEIWDTRAGATNNNPQLLEWQLNFRLVPRNPLPIIYLSHGIPFSGALPAGGVQYFVVDVPQWAFRATNVLQNSSLPVTVLFNQTNFPGNQALIGPSVTSGTNILTTNTIPPLVIGQPYYLAVTNANALPVTFSLGVWFDITTLANCQPATNFVGLAGIPRYFQFDVPINRVPPREATFRLSGAETNVTVVLSQHLPLPNLAYADYISQQPCTNNEIILVMTNSTPFPLQANRWYVGVFDTAPTNVFFTAEACYSAINPTLIPLMNAVPYVAAFTNQFVAPPGPPRYFFFTFEITNFVDAVLFELYGMSGDADLVLERDGPPGMAPYFARSSRTEKWAEQIVLRTSSELPDLRGKWYVGVYNNELTNVAYTIRATVPSGGMLVSAQSIVVTNGLFQCSSRLLSWNSVEGERYFVQFAADGVNWTTLGSMTATTPCATFVVPCMSGFTPVSWWQGEGNAIDSADGNNGILSSGMSFVPRTNGCQAFGFNGINADVRVPAATNLNVGLGGGFTIETWINPANLTSARPLVEWNDGSFYGVHLWLFAWPNFADGSALYLNVLDTALGNHGIFTAPGTITNNGYQHVAATYNKTDGMAALYINGTMVIQQALGVFTPRTIGDLYFGLRPAGPGAGTRYIGAMDEVSIFNRPLAAAEIQTIYNAGGNGKCTGCASVPAPISWWRAETNSIDSVDGNHGTLSGNVTYGPGLVGRSFIFDGNQDAVNVGIAPNLQLQDFSIETWIKRTSASIVTSDTNGVGNRSGDIFVLGRPGGGYRFRVRSDGVLGFGKQLINEVTSGARVLDTNWHHVGVTKFGTRVVFYVDGVAYPVPPYDSGGFTFSTPGLIGAWRNQGGQIDDTFYGAIDELAIYGRELTAAEIQAIYAAAGAGKCVGNFRVVQVQQFSSIPLPVYTPLTNSVGPGLITTFAVDVPSWASFATNSLVFADGPVNLLFNQLVRPTGAGGDTVLLANSMGGVVTLNTNGAPQLLPGQRYYLGVENLSTVPVNFALQVDFNFTQLSNGVPVRTVADSPALPRYFYFDVSTNATAVAFQLFFLTGNANLVVRKNLPPLPTPVSNDYGSFNVGNTGENIFIFTNSTPVPLSAGRWYIGVFDAAPAPVAYTIQALEFTNVFPAIITLTNAIPYFNTNSGAAGNIRDFYRFVVSTNAVRAQFEINGPSADMTLVARKGLPLPGLASFDYISANPTTNDELIMLFTNSTPVALSAGDWFLSAINVSGGPATYAIKATEWPLTGRPIVITNSVVINNSFFCLTWTSLPGVHYHVEALTSLNSTNWVTVSPTITATDYSTTWCLPLPSPYHFFRVVEGPALGAPVPSPVTTIGSIIRTNNTVRLQWSGPTSATYQVQWTPTLTPPVWTTVPGNGTSPSGQFQFLDDGTQTGELGPTRFYRLLKL